MRVGSRIVRGILRQSDRLFVYLTYAVLSVMMLSTTADVSLRYLLNHPLGRVIELNQLLLPVFVFFALSQTQRLRGHISVDLLTGRLPARTQEILALLTYVLGLCFISLVGLETAGTAVKAYQQGQTLFGSYPRMPTWWSKASVSVGCWLLCLQYIRDSAGKIASLRHWGV